MKIIRYPKKASWPKICVRPAFNTRSVDGTVREILLDVRANGDDAVRRYSRQFDKVVIDSLAVTPQEFAAAGESVADDLKAAIQTAKTNIEKFHCAQRDETTRIETTPGVFCWRRSVAIEKVGLYIPAGTAPLFSTVLMLAVPAQLAGCKDIILCSPPDAKGRIDPLILYTAKISGITKVFTIGGAQAIGALAYGTASVPRVDKIFGPGNNYVTCAKQIVSTEIAIDMPAGPSEVAVLADASCDPAFVAADLLSQAEHGRDSQVLLVTPHESVIKQTLAEIDKQITKLSRKDTAKAVLTNSRAVLVKGLATGIDLVNEYAAEHLILAVDDAEAVAERIANAGSVFLGNYSCESAGDYASGTNHTLPTAGFARSFSGVSLDGFVKKITFQKLTADGIRNLGPIIERLAAAEGLDGHKNAVSVRLEKLNAA